MKLFTEHPNSLGETYIQHCLVAASLSLKLLAASLAQLVHAVFPFINPPCGTDVCSMAEYLEGKKPGARRCNEETI
tara:strand:+ start:1500 stop:1727 length:228 start_codon:yes stop_codon:yes gene_type:complete